MGRRNGICQRTCDPTLQGCPFPFFPPFQTLPTLSHLPSSPSVILLIPPLVLPVSSIQSSHVIGHRHNSRLNCIHDAGPSSLFLSMLAHARLPSASWSLDSDESLRSEPQSHLASRPAFAKCKPISNKHTHSAWTFAHALGTAVQSTHQQYPLPIVSPPQSQDTIHTHGTRIESSGLRNDTHTRETHNQDRNPMPYCPLQPRPSRLARALPRPAAQNNAMVSSWRNDHTERHHGPRGAMHQISLLRYAWP